MAKKTKKKKAPKRTTTKDWRTATLARMRKLIEEADPDAVEEMKWKKPSNPKGVPTWSHNGIICTGETYKDKVKLTFARGASLKDPSRLFNASLDGGTRRAVDIREGNKINESAFKSLIREAAELNSSKKKPGSKKPKLLSGDNPQIAKGYGNAPVQAYIAAIPGWKQSVAKRIDALVAKTVPGMKRAVKWNSPLYGVEEGTWFASFHCFTNYVKVTFFKGTSLKPIPAGTSKHKTVRYYDIREGEFEEKQFVSWIKQASKLPGEKM